VRVGIGVLGRWLNRPDPSAELQVGYTALPTNVVSRKTQHSWRVRHQFAFEDPSGRSDLTGFIFEMVERYLSILADLDEVPVGITHVASPFHAVIV